MNIVINPHNLLTPGSIKVNKRIGNKVISKKNIKFKDFNMNGAIHSINLPDVHFTNFVKSYEKKIYIELKQIFDDIIINKKALDEELLLVDNENQNGSKEERLKEIIRENLNIKNVPSLMKFKIKAKKDDQTLDGVRIYVYYDKNMEEFDLYLIDLYHLGIDGVNYKIGRYDLEGRYSVNSTHKKCISKIADSYIM